MRAIASAILMVTVGSSVAIAQDVVPPTVASVVRVSGSPTNASSVDYTVTFSEPVSGVDVSDFTVTLTGTAAGTVSNVVAVPTVPADSVYTVTVGTVSGDGTLRLDVVADGSIQDGASNPMVVGFTSGETYTIDNTAPSVVSIVRAGASPTGASSVGFTVTLSEAVTGLDATDFVLATSGTSGSITSVTGTGPYTVTVTSVSGTGTLGLNLVDDDTVVDGASNALGGAGAGNGDFTGEVYTIDQSSPSVVSVERVTGSPTNASSVDYTVTFTKPVTGVDASDFTVTSTGTASGSVSSVSGSGTTYTVTVGTVTGDGTLRLDVLDDDTIIDAVSNPLGGAGAGNGAYSSGETYTIDNTAPSVVISSSESSPTSASPIPVTITFSEVVSGFALGDVAASNATTANLQTLDSTVFTVDVTPVSQGSVTVDVSGGVASDAAGNGNTAATQFAITYDFNESPVVDNVIPDQSATEDSAFLFTFAADTFSDPDGDVLTYAADQSSGAALPGWLGFNPSTRTFSGTPTNDDVAVLSIRVTASDPEALSVADIFLLTVNNTNDPPVLATPIPDQSATQDVPFSFTFAANTFSDVDGDALSYAAERHNGQPLPSWLSFNDVTRTFTGTPGNGDVGRIMIRVIASDPSLASANDVFDIVVNNVNDPPSFTSTPVTGATQDVAYTYNVTASDDDGDALTISEVSALPAWLDLVDNGNGTATLSGTPGNDDVGPHDIDLEVSDGGLTDSQSFTITVANVNDAPTFTSTAITSSTQGVAYSYSITTADIDGDSRSITAASVLPSWLSLVDNTDGTATLSGTPSNDDVGPHSISLQVSDGLLTSLQNFTITVANANDAPVFTSTATTGATQDVLYSYSIVTSDPDGDTVTISADGVLPSWLTLDDNGDGTGTLFGTPTNSDVGSHAVTLRVSDGALSTTQPFSIVVANVNDPPSFTSSPITVATEDIAYSYAITATDPDGNGLVISEVTTLPDWLTLTDNLDGTASLAGTPTNSDVGPHDIDIQVSDGSLSDVQSFTIVVSNVNDPPSFTSTPVTGASEDATYVYNITASDIDGDDLSFSASTIPGWLSLVDNGNGTALLSGTPLNEDVGANPVTLNLSDGSVSVQQSFTVTVTNTNDAPFFTSTPVTGAIEDQAYTYNITTDDVDAGSSLTIIASTKPAWLTLVDNGNGTASLSGTPSNANVGDHSVTLEVLDGITSTPQSFTITVSNVNDSPSFSTAPVTTATEDSPYVYNIVGTDPDGADALTFTATTKPAWLSLVDNGNRTARLSGTPSNSDVGLHSVVIELSDGTETVIQSFNITVVNTNDPPSFTSTPVLSATEDVAYQYNVVATDVDAGAVLSITATTLPAWLFLSDNGDGTADLSGTPDNDDVGSHNVALEVSDGTLTGAQSFTVTVANVNDAPSIVSPPVTGATQDQTYTYNVVASDADVGDVLAYTGTTVPAWLSLVDNGDGTATLSGTPANSDVGLHAVELRVDDLAGAFDTQTFEINVRNTNDPPVAVDDSYTVSEGGTLVTNASGPPPRGVLFNDIDPDGDALTAFIVTPPSNGSLTLNLNGTFSYTHDGSETIIDSFEYFTTDGTFVSNTATATITVTPVNDPPSFSSSPVTSGTQGIAYRYDITTQDPDGPTLTLTAPTLPAWLNLGDNGDGTGQLIGTPSNADVGVHSVILRVSDGLAFSQQSFSITVGDVNDPPTITSVPVTVATQDVLYTYDLTATDPDGNTLTYSGQTVPGWLTLFDNGDGTARLSGTPSNGDVGSNPVVIRVTDGVENDEQSFAIVVANVNDAPFFSSTPVTAATQDISYSYNASTVDPDGDPVTIVAVTKPAWLSFADNDDGTATLSGTPTNSEVGVHAVTLRVSDGSLSEDQSFSITVANVNEAPSFTSTPVTSATEDAPYIYAVSATDPDGTPLSFSASTLPSWLTLMDQGDGTATLSGTPTNDFVGSNPVVLVVSDGSLSAQQSFAILVANTNDAPTFTSTAVTSATQDAPYSYDVTTADVDGDAVTISAPTLPSWLTLVDAGDGTASLTGTPTNAHIGVHSVVLRVTDGSLSTDQSFSVTVNNQNDPPQFTSTPVTSATEDVTYVYSVSASDPDTGTSLTFTATTLPVWLALFDNGDGTATLTGTPRNRHVGSHDVVIRVSDGSLSVQQAFTIVVANVNDPPVFASTPLTAIAEDQAYLYEISVSDEDGDTIELTSPTLPSWLTLTDNGDGTAVLSGTPVNADVGVHSVVIRASDGTVNVDQSFSITVTNANDPPVFTSTPVTSATEDVAYEYTAVATDVDLGTALTLSATTLPAWLVFSDNGDGTGSLSGTPANADVGSHLVVLQASDGLATGSQSFSITVANVNDAPRFVSPPVTGALQGQQYTYDIVVEDDDAGDVISIDVVTLPTWLTLVDNGDGTGRLRGTPSNDNVGEHSVVLRATDASDATDTQSFTITVRNTNDAPIAASDMYTVDEGGTLSALGDIPGVLDNDVDPDQDALTATLVTGVSHGTLEFNLDGTFVYVHDGGETTSDSFEYIANDGIFVSNVGQVQITVTPVNDPPAITSTPVSSASQGEEYSYLVETTDPDSPSVVLSAEILPDWLSFVDNGDGTGVVSGTPTNADVGVHPVLITAFDGTDTSQQSYSIDVGNTNDPPIFTSVPVTAAVQDQPYQYDAAAIDPDGDQVSFTAPTLPSWVNLVDNGDGTATLSGSPSASDVGAHSVSIEASDGVEATTQSFTITVVDVNDAPTFSSEPVTRGVQDREYLYDVTTEDADGDQISITATQIPDWLTLTDNGDGTARLSGTPGEADLGNHDVILTASDGLESVNQSFTISVDNGNSIPVAVADVYPLDEGGTIVGTAGRAPRGILDNDTDADGDALTATLVDDVVNGVLVLEADGSFSYTHDGSETTSDGFTYTASDGRDVSNETTVTFNIIPVNDRPIARDDDVSATEDEQIVLNLLINDEDAEGPVTLNSVTAPLHGSAVINADSTVIYTPASEYAGLDEFRYTIVDDDGAVSDTATVRITVRAVNDPPIAADDAVTTGESAPVVVLVTANDVDPDGDTLVVTGVTDASAGTTAVGSIPGTVRYVPNEGFLGEDSFSYTVSDGNGGTDDAEVIVTVTALKFAVQETGTVGGAASRGFAINDRGEVVGTSVLPSGQVKAFVWSDAGIRELEPDLMRGSQAYGISNSGVVVGAVEDAGGIAASRWEAGSGKFESTVLSTLDGAFSVALDVNERDEIVGTALTSDVEFHPVLWQGTTLTVISVDGLDVGQAEAINGTGELVGSVMTSSSGERAIRGSLLDVRQISSADSRAYAINDLGVAVGSKVDGSSVVAAVWSRDGTESDLPAPGATFSEAYGVNDSGWIVGAFGRDESAGTSSKTGSSNGLFANDPLFVGSDGSRISIDFGKSIAELEGLGKTGALDIRAALWVGGSVLDLNALVPESSGWTLIEARDVNNSGQITGYGLFQGASRAFVLTLTGNEAPSGKSDRATTFTNEPVVLDLLANDSDADGDTLAVIALTRPQFGEAEIIDSRNVVYRPLTGFIGEDTFSYTVADGRGGSSKAEVTISVEEVPEQFELAQNYPNPFNPSTTIAFVLPVDSEVTLEVFDALGRMVATLISEDRARGRHEVRFDAGDLPNGMYVYRLRAGGFVESRKFVLLK